MPRRSWRCIEPDAVHYFPAGAPQGTFVGAQAIADGWLRAVANLGSIWTIDRMLVDAPRLEAVIEWTHFKPKQGVYLRGDEWYVFSTAGLISEIRAYYACPTATSPVRTHELGDFALRGARLSARRRLRSSVEARSGQPPESPREDHVLRELRADGAGRAGNRRQHAVRAASRDRRPHDRDRRGNLRHRLHDHRRPRRPRHPVRDRHALR